MSLERLWINCILVAVLYIIFVAIEDWSRITRLLKLMWYKLRQTLVTEPRIMHVCRIFVVSDKKRACIVSDTGYFSVCVCVRAPGLVAIWQRWPKGFRNLCVIWPCVWWRVRERERERAEEMKAMQVIIIFVGRSSCHRKYHRGWCYLYYICDSERELITP